MQRLTIRSVTENELDSFASVGVTPESARRMRAFLDEIFALEESRPEWCFLALADGVPLARVIYVAHNHAAGDFALYGLALPWEDDPVATGRALIEESRAAMAGRVKLLHLAFNDDDERAAIKSELARALGWPSIQEKLRYELTPPAGSLERDGRLSFRSFEEVGQEAFVAAIARVTEGTLDRVLRDEVEAMGLTQSAARHLEDLTHMDGRTQRYELAYDERGALVGLIVPSCYGDEMGVIAYIGVVPEQRGAGYAKGLLRRGVEVLEATEPALARIVADVDAENAPMVRAFERQAFRRVHSKRLFRAPSVSL